MSNETEHKLNAIGSWVIKGVVALACWFAIQTFDDMKDSVVEMKTEFKEMRKDFEEVTRVVVKHDTEIKALGNEVEKLDREKQDK